MKTSKRVHRNRTTRPAAKQSKTKAGNTVTVVISSIEDGQEMLRVDFPTPLFTAVQAGAKRLGISLDKFLHDAIASAIEAGEGEFATAGNGGGR